MRETLNKFLERNDALWMETVPDLIPPGHFRLIRWFLFVLLIGMYHVAIAVTLLVAWVGANEISKVAPALGVSDWVLSVIFFSIHLVEFAWITLVVGIILSYMAAVVRDARRRQRQEAV